MAVRTVVAQDVVSQENSGLVTTKTILPLSDFSIVV